MAGFLLFCFDYQQAQVSGLRTRWLHYGLLCMVSLTIVATLKAVGIILSISLLIARRHCGTPDATLSYCAPAGDRHIGNGLDKRCLDVVFIDSAPAPTIVVLFAVVFIITFIVTSIIARTRENAGSQDLLSSD